MGNPVKSEDVLNDDLFDSANKSARDFLQTVKMVEDQLKNLLVTSQQSLLGNTFKNSSDVNRFNDDLKKSIAIQDAATKASINADRAEQAHLKTLAAKRVEQNKVNKEIENAAKIQAKATKEAQKANDVYEQAKVRLNQLSKQLKTLSVAGQDSAVSTQILRKEFNELKNQVDIAEQSVGQFQRNVGNYPGAVNKYELSLNKLGKGLRGLGGIGRFVADSLNIPPEVFIGLQEAGKLAKELHHTEGLATAVKAEQTAATTAHTEAVIAETAAEEESSAVSNIALGLWGLCWLSRSKQ